MITATLRQLADFVQGHPVGDPDLAITGAATLQDALPGQISFVDHPKLRARLRRRRPPPCLSPATGLPLGDPPFRLLPCDRPLRPSFPTFGLPGSHRAKGFIRPPIFILPLSWTRMLPCMPMP